MWLSVVCLQVVTVEPAGLSSNHAKKLRLLLVSAMLISCKSSASL